MFLRADTHEIRVLLDRWCQRRQGSRRCPRSFPRRRPSRAGRPARRKLRRRSRCRQVATPGRRAVLRISATSETQPASSASVRTLAIEPWRYDGQTVTVTGNFRGRNLYGDLPGAPGKSKYDFVLRGTEGAVWVTDLRPRGQGFELDVNRRVDTDRWVEVTGTVVREKGLVSVKATRMSLSKAPQSTSVADEPPVPAVELTPVQVVFNSPTEGETDVSGTSPDSHTVLAWTEREFACGEHSGELPGSRRQRRIQVGVRRGQSRHRRSPSPKPLEAFRTVRIELLDGIKGFDGAPFKPWTVTFSVGG